jgi:hypothetical protein
MPHTGSARPARPSRVAQGLALLRPPLRQCLGQQAAESRLFLLVVGTSWLVGVHRRAAVRTAMHAETQDSLGALASGLCCDTRGGASRPAVLPGGRRRRPRPPGQPASQPASQGRPAASKRGGRYVSAASKRPPVPPPRPHGSDERQCLRVRPELAHVVCEGASRNLWPTQEGGPHHVPRRSRLPRRGCEWWW